MKNADCLQTPRMNLSHSLQSIASTREDAEEALQENEKFDGGSEMLEFSLNEAEFEKRTAKAFSALTATPLFRTEKQPLFSDIPTTPLFDNDVNLSASSPANSEGAGQFGIISSMLSHSLSVRREVYQGK